MDRSHYLIKVFKRSGMSVDKHGQQRHLSMFMTLCTQLAFNDERADPTDQHRVGSCMYAAILSRPNSSLALGQLSQYLADPAEFHSKAPEGLMRYLGSTVEHALVVTSMSGPCMDGHCESDFAMDKRYRVSVLGNGSTLAGRPISWMSRKQKSVATSTKKQNAWQCAPMQNSPNGLHIFSGIWDTRRGMVQNPSKQQ